MSEAAATVPPTAPTEPKPIEPLPMEPMPTELPLELQTPQDIQPKARRSRKKRD